MKPKIVKILYPASNGFNDISDANNELSYEIDSNNLVNDMEIEINFSDEFKSKSFLLNNLYCS